MVSTAVAATLVPGGSSQMRGKSLMLIGSTPPATGAGLVDEVLRFWSESDRPPVSTHTIEAILSDPGPLDKECQVAWILLDQPQLKGMYDLIALLQDRHLPSLVTRPQENNPLGGAILEGAVAAPPTSPPAAIAAVLRTLWGQGDVLHILKTELSMLYLQHGGVIDQFGKIDEELRLAAQLQRDFLPVKLPESPSIEIDVLFRPAGYVSGDIYDVRRLDEKHVGIFLADAVGHGVPAALMTAYIKSSLAVRQFDAEVAFGGRIVPPHETLGLLNVDILQSRSAQVRTATAVYGILNTQTLEMEIARAGHPYPILVRADGSPLSLAPDGAMMGVFPDEVYELATVQLHPGDRLLLYTDGFEMAFPGPRSATSGRKRAVPNDHYIQEFRELAHLPISQIVAKLAARLDLQVGSLNQFDDMTVLFVGIAAPPPHCHRGRRTPFGDCERRVRGGGRKSKVKGRGTSMHGGGMSSLSKMHRESRWGQHYSAGGHPCGTHWSFGVSSVRGCSTYSNRARTYTIF